MTSIFLLLSIFFNIFNPFHLQVKMGQPVKWVTVCLKNKPGWLIKNLHWFRWPGVVSALTPRLGIVHEYKMSVAVTIIWTKVFIGSVIWLSVSKSQKLLIFNFSYPWFGSWQRQVFFLLLLHSGQFWGHPNYTWYRGSFPRGKEAGVWSWTLTSEI